MPAVSRPSTSASQPDTSAISATTLNLPGRREGKVRDTYELPPAAPGQPPRMLIVASDRISAFDVVMPTPIAGKGRLLTEISTFWFTFIQSKGLGPIHILSTNADDIPDAAFAPPATTTRAQLVGRVTIGRRCRVIPVECVVRGYLEGSGWKDYLQTGAVCGVKLPVGLKQCDRLPEPIFTPATKAPKGQHDENISFDQACQIVGSRTMERLRERSIAIYKAASDYARDRGIIIADTKFEFGLPEEGGSSEPILIDEALTPDSSRFWPADTYRPGSAQKSFDKQYLREYLQSLADAGQWNKAAPGPALPPEIVAKTFEKYALARDRLCS